MAVRAIQGGCLSSIFLILLLGLGLGTHASITVYSPQPFMGTATGTANVVTYTNAAAYDSTTLNPPAIPDPRPPTAFAIQLSSSPVPGVSIPQAGHFYGFSLEFSVINQVLGLNGSFLQVPFLNLMSNLQARGGSVRVRIGGNSQETATLVQSLPDERMMEKGAPLPSDTMLSTPPLLYTPEVLYMLANISSLVNVQWYLGIPMNDTQHLRLDIVEVAESILGDRLIGFQVANEPDQYGLDHLRPITYNASDYVHDFGLVDAALRADPAKFPSVNKKLIGPSISSHWKLEDVWDTGFLDTYSTSLGTLSAEYYPLNNCARLFNNSHISVNPQDVFSSYLNHTSATSIVQRYLNSTAIAQRYNLPFVMLETNSATCGGFPGVSDSFGSALWALDYGLQLAYSNFSGALTHVGGLSSYYNAFTPPPTNQSMFKSWTVGPIYYSALVAAEVFGKSNQSQILDLQMNEDNIYTPGYAIYDKNVLSRLALFNFITDSTGGSDYTVAVSVPGGSTVTQVKVKYLLAPSVSSLANITWAGQSLGHNLSSDGRLSGPLDIQSVPCDPSSQTCHIRVPAPGFALVFLDDTNENTSEDPTAMTFPTTMRTKTLSALTVDPSVLAASNGALGMQEALGSTGRGKKWWSLADPRPGGKSQKKGRHHRNGATRDQQGSSALALVAVAFLFRL
ncbi:glycoside hydrolase family 79 protein, partial [Mycena amicta]